MTPTPLFDDLLRRIESRLAPVEAAPRLEAGAASPAAAGAGLPSPTASDFPARAAVTLFLRPDGSGRSAEILFIKRAQRAGDPWSGHLALPGGREEAEDATILDVAVREAVEEVGIDVRAGGRPLGWLPPFTPASARIPRIVVMPLVARAPDGAVPRLQPEEVDAAFWMSLDSLRDGGKTARVRFTMEGAVREFPAYPSPHGPIWGITERIISGFISLVEKEG